MRVFIYGQCDSYGSGAWCYYKNILEMGHEVSFYSPNAEFGKYKSAIYKVIRKLNGGEALSFDRKRHISSFIKQVTDFKPQVIIILKGLLIDMETIRQLKREDAWVVLINHDDFFSAFKNSRSCRQFQAVPEYDFIFPTKEVNVEELSIYNSNIEFFPFSFFPKIHKPPKNSADVDSERWLSDLVFIGTCYPERVKQLEYLVENIGCSIDLKIYGGSWNKIGFLSPLRKFIQGKILDPEEMSKAIYHSKIALGFLCKENRDDYTQRTFEIPASKGVLLAERTERHLSYFKEDEEAVFFSSSNYQELVDKVKLLLSDDNYRESIRERGHISVINGGHTYKCRLERLFRLYNLRKDIID